MFTKPSKSKFNFWGDDHPEKLNETPQNPSFSRQLKDLVNPTKMLDQIFQTKTSENQYYPGLKEKKAKVPKQETLLFSYQSRHEDVKIKQETAQILEGLKKQIILLEKSQKSLNKEITK